MMKSMLNIYDIEKGESRVVKVFDSHIEAPNWTRDGANLVYNSYGHIYLFNLLSQESTLIETGLCTLCNNDHVLCADGKRIAISAGTEDHKGSRIWILPLAGGEPRLITALSPSYLHGWSPDGSTLAYCAERRGNYDVYIISAAGGEEIRLTTAEGLDDGPEYSPDGKHIWFNSVRSGLMQIWRMNSDGSDQTQMTDDGYNNWFGHVSPDGEKVVFVSYDPAQVKPGDHPANKDIKIRMMSTQGGSITTLLSAFGGQGTMNVNSWAPNSCEFTFVTYEL
jgi:Tol biopolymer transport system component